MRDAVRTIVTGPLSEGILVAGREQRGQIKSTSKLSVIRTLLEHGAMIGNMLVAFLS